MRGIAGLLLAMIVAVVARWAGAEQGFEPRRVEVELDVRSQADPVRIDLEQPVRIGTGAGERAP